MQRAEPKPKQDPLLHPGIHTPPRRLKLDPARSCTSLTLLKRASEFEKCIHRHRIAYRSSPRGEVALNLLLKFVVSHSFLSLAIGKG